MQKVSYVAPLANHIIAVEFADGLKGTFNVAPYMQSEFFKRLEDETYFRQVRVFLGGVGWPEGHDLGPDTIAAELITTEYMLNSFMEKK